MALVTSGRNDKEYLFSAKLGGGPRSPARLVARAPRFHRIEDGTECPALLRERVFDVRRHRLMHRARHDAVLLERAQLQGEHALGDAGDQPTQFVEAARTVLEVKEDRRFPAS